MHSRRTPTCGPASWLRNSYASARRVESPAPDDIMQDRSPVAESRSSTVSRTCYRSRITLAVSSLAFTVTASGQLARTSAFLGSEGPSTFLGAVGSYNTFFGPTPDFSRRIDYQSSSIPNFSRGRGAQRPLTLPNALRPSDVRLGMLPTSHRYSFLRESTPNEGRLKAATGIYQIEDFGNLPGWTPAPFPPLRTSPYTTTPRDSWYHRYFNLTREGRPGPEGTATEARAEADAQGTAEESAAEGTSPLLVPPPRKPTPSLASHSERILAVRFQLLAQEAMEAFREATETEVSDRPEKLARASRLLTSVSRLDERSFSPSLLNCYIAMEKEQYITALFYLFDGSRRNPDVFANPPELYAFFGDPELLRARAREMLLVNAENNANLYALQAFCAWLLRDEARMVQAAEAAVKAAYNRPDRPKFESLRFCMTYSLNRAGASAGQP